MSEYADLYEPEPDDIPRAELGEHNEMWAVVCEALYDWQSDHAHGLHLTLRGSEHGTGSFLDYLAARGYRVTPIEPLPPIEALLGAPE